MSNTFVLKGDICYSNTQTQLHTHKDSYLVCEDGRSAGVYDTLPARYQSLPISDHTGKLIVPGLVDLHFHAPQFAFRGMGMDLELLDWLNTYTFPEEAKYSDLRYAEKAYSLLVQDLTQGPNTRACVFATVHRAATLLLMEKLEASGLVTMVGKVNMDRNSQDSLCEANAEASAADTIRWIEEQDGRFQNTSPILTPRFIPSCSDSLMQRLGEIQQQYGLPVQSHLSENHSEIDWVRELCPESKHYGDAYAHFGLFGGDAPTVMAHCVWSGEAEQALMRQNGVFVAHCPQSNTNLASGIAPVRQFLNRGISTGLGSDVAGGCHLSIFRAMADAIQVSKLYWRLVDQSMDPLTVEEAFYLATVGGGAFFGKVGSFSPGYEFDALVIKDEDYRAPYALSIRDRLSRTIYLSENRSIIAKYVRGRLVHSTGAASE